VLFRSEDRGERPSRGGGDRDYRNASGFNSRKAKPRNDNFPKRDGDFYESRSAGQSERQSFRDGDFRDNRGPARGGDFRNDRSEGKRTPTDRNWNAKEGRSEYRSDFRNDFSDRRPQGDRPYGDRPRGDRPQGDRPQGGRPYGDRPRGDRPQGDRPYGDRPRGDRPQGDRPYNDRPRGDKRPSGKAVFSKPQRGDGYGEGRGDGYEGNNRSENFGVKPRTNKGKPAQGKKPFVFKGNSRKPSRAAE
jgi:hypothetical protein